MTKQVWHKYFRLPFLLLLIACFAIACQPRAKVPTSRPSDPIPQTQEEPKKIESPASANPQTGVERTGGGGNDVRKKAARAQVEAALGQIQIAVRWAVNKFKHAYSEQIYLLAWNIKPEVKPNEPCSWEGTPKAGTADVGKNSICLSVDSITEQILDEQSVFVATVALAAHEYCHLLKNTHEECEEFQKDLRKSMSNPGEELSDLIAISDLFRYTLAEVQSDAECAIWLSNQALKSNDLLYKLRDGSEIRTCDRASHKLEGIHYQTQILQYYAVAIDHSGLAPIKGFAPFYDVFPGIDGEKRHIDLWDDFTHLLQAGDELPCQGNTEKRQNLYRTLESIVSKTDSLAKVLDSERSHLYGMSKLIGSHQEIMKAHRDKCAKSNVPDPQLQR